MLEQECLKGAPQATYIYPQTQVTGVTGGGAFHAAMHCRQMLLLGVTCFCMSCRVRGILVGDFFPTPTEGMDAGALAVARPQLLRRRRHGHLHRTRFHSTVSQGPQQHAALQAFARHGQKFSNGFQR